MREVALVLLVALAAGEAQAGAWTEDKGHWQIITSFEAANAAAGYDADGRPDPAIKYDKLYLKSLVEYGWRDGVTLFAQPEFVLAKSPSMDTSDAALEIGARLRLSQRYGIFSLQVSYKLAGPPDLSNSRGNDSAQIAELRSLYGTNFHLFGRDGFVDIETAQRWITRPRPDETVLDGTLGLWLGPRNLMMLQSFNVISGENAELPYTDFRNHKIELSVVRVLSPRWSLQTGAFFSPAGKNSLVEQGLETALWLRF
jgi:hypothetical protein